jgi:hypothetical protein
LRDRTTKSEFDFRWNNRKIDDGERTLVTMIEPRLQRWLKV